MKERKNSTQIKIILSFLIITSERAKIICDARNESNESVGHMARRRSGFFFCSELRICDAFFYKTIMAYRLLIAILFARITSGFVGSLQRKLTNNDLCAVRIAGYEEAINIIDSCSSSYGTPSDDLYDAVRFIDKNAFKIYPNLDEKQELWDRAHGSWKLQMATGGGKSTTFKRIPIFAFAMIDENNFGNGVGLNENFILLSLLGPHTFNTRQRRMFIQIDDIFLGGSNFSNNFPDFLKDKLSLGKTPDDFKKPPAFTFIGASEKSLIARGGTGGIAIWTRLEKDIRPAAYMT